MSRNGIGVIHYFTSIWNSGTYILELNKKIGFFIKMFVCTELHKYQNSLRPDEKQKLINFINQTKEIKKTLILSDTEEPTFEEYKTYLGTVYKTFEEEEKKGIINSITPNKLRLIGDLCEPLNKFNAFDGPFKKLQQYERYKAKMYEEGLKNGITPTITPLSTFKYNPLDDIKYFSLFKPEIMDIKVNQQNNNNNMQNQMVYNIGMNYDMGNNNMNYDNNNMNNNNNNNMNYNMNNNNDNMNNNMNYDMNNNMNYDNYNINFNNPYEQIGLNYEDGNNNNNNMNFTNPYTQQQNNVNNPYQNQPTNENNYNLNNPGEMPVKTYSNDTKIKINKTEEIFDMSDSILEEKKQSILNKNKNAINELKKKNISLAMQYIANSIGILKNFPKEKKTDFI